MRPIILLIATLDTKAEEALYLKEKIVSYGCDVILMDPGILGDSSAVADITRYDIAKAAGTTVDALVATKDKGLCIRTMMNGVESVTKTLYMRKGFHGIIAVGGAQGTDIGTCAMRVLPFGIPKFMVSTVASGRAMFGPYVGTKDIIMMHSVADIQGINFLTQTVFDNAAAAISSMTKQSIEQKKAASSRIPVAMSMLGTTTPGAMRAKKLLHEQGFDAIAFHQNGTGGIAMEDMIGEGFFKGVLDINLHEIGDYVAGGLHAAIRDYRLETAGKCGLPQVVAPGSIYYTVQGPYDTLSPEMKKRKLIVHNPQLTLVRLSHDELVETGKQIARKLNMAKGPTHLFLPLRGLAYPDSEGLPHWDPEANQIFFESLKKHLSASIPVDELNLHINDEAFIDIVVDKFLSFMRKGYG